MVYYLFDNVGKNFNVSHYAHVYCHTHLKIFFVIGLEIYETIRII